MIRLRLGDFNPDRELGGQSTDGQITPHRKSKNLDKFIYMTYAEVAALLDHLNHQLNSKRYIESFNLLKKTLIHCLL